MLSEILLNPRTFPFSTFFETLKEELEAINEKCRELTPEELKEVTGGHAIGPNVSGVIDSALTAGILYSVIQ